MVKPNKLRTATSVMYQIGYRRLIVCIFFGLIGAWFSFALAVSGVTRLKNPELALALVPSDSAALAARADQLFLANVEGPPNLMRLLAIEALRQQAVNPKALRLLGIYADIKGQNTDAKQFILMSARLSRRDVGAQLWLIESAARKNDNRLALRHFDIALRTTPLLQATLFPRLLSAIEDRDVRLALAPYMRKKAGWVESFLFFAVEKSKNLPALADLLVESSGVLNTESKPNPALELIARLVSEGYFLDALRLYKTIPGAPLKRLTNPSFDQDEQDYGPIGWKLIDGPDSGGSFIRNAGGAGYTLSVFANSGTTGVVTSRLLFLQPAQYFYTARLTEIQRGDGGFLRWQLRCLGGKNSELLWTFDSVSSIEKASFTVPLHCSAQYLDLIVSGGQGRNGLEVKIDSVSIVATGN